MTGTGDRKASGALLPPGQSYEIRMLDNRKLGELPEINGKLVKVSREHRYPWPGVPIPARCSPGPCSWVGDIPGGGGEGGSLFAPLWPREGPHIWPGVPGRLQVMFPPSPEHLPGGFPRPAAAVHGAPAAGGLEVEQTWRQDPGHR